MKVSELKQGQSADVEVSVTEISDSREFSKFGRPMKVATATVEDESGSVKMSLWNEDVDRVHAGDKIKLTNGYVNEFQGEKQLTAGKFGKIEVIGKAEKPTENVHEKKEKEKKSKNKEESEEAIEQTAEEFGEESEELESEEEF